ncbi:MAG: hypothetical protein AB1505_23735 [Candidatus Latescibacterota bacterium]
MVHVAVLAIGVCVMAAARCAAQSSAIPDAHPKPGAMEPSGTATEDGSTKAASVDSLAVGRRVRVSVGYGWYGMEQFDAKLDRERNERIEGGMCMSLELEPWAGTDWSFLGPLRAMVLPMLGVEALLADSKTTHIQGAQAATVHWALPAVGVYIAPRLEFAARRGAGALRWHARPVGAGYYALGRLMDARLTVTDRIGWLDASGSTIGFASQGGVEFGTGPARFYLEGGWRHLQFSGVLLEPRRGWVPRPGEPAGTTGEMPESLDYGGVFAKGGMTVEF